MSRTIRRKNAKWAVTGDYDFVAYNSKYGGVYYKDHKYDKKDKCYKKFWNSYHSDKKSCQSSVAPWFVNRFFQRPYRRDSKNQLRKYMLNNDYCVVLTEYRKSAGYDYW